MRDLSPGLLGLTAKHNDTYTHTHTQTHAHNQKQMNLISKTTAAYNWPCKGKIELYSYKKIIMPKNNLGMVLEISRPIDAVLLK